MNNFKGGFGGGGMQNLMRQAQKMQEDMAKAQEELANSVITSTSGGGMVEVVMTGKKEIQSIKLKKEAVDPDDIEMLEDLIVACINDAMKKVDSLTQEKMGSFSGALGGLM